MILFFLNSKCQPFHFFSQVTVLSSHFFQLFFKILFIFSLSSSILSWSWRYILMSFCLDWGCWLPKFESVDCLPYAVLSLINCADNNWFGISRNTILKNSRQFGIPIVDVSISLCQTPDHDRKREQTLVNVLTLFFKISSCTSSADALASSQINHADSGCGDREVLVGNFKINSEDSMWSRRFQIDIIAGKFSSFLSLRVKV